MYDAVVLCRDDLRRGQLINMFIERAGNTLKPRGYVKPQDMRGMVEVKRERVRLIVLSLIGGADVSWSMDFLRESFRNARIIVELDADDSEKAFDVIRWGAFSAVTRNGDLWDMITKATGRQRRPYETFLEVYRPQRKWGFMSMSFDSARRDNDDYRLAIRPTMLRLQLGLKRFDEIVREPGVPILESMIAKLITERPGFVAQMSSYTLNTAWEIGFACGQNKSVILLRRSTTTQPIPTLLKGLARIEYSSMTELAMKLFFGLGGTRADLDKCPKSWLADSGNGDLSE